jgi:tetratricopeptide (TPR) repeat protein
MMMLSMQRIKIRPGFSPYVLSAAILLTVGSALLRDGLLSASLACFLTVVLVVIAALFDYIEFDGQKITHHGPLAFILYLLTGVRRELHIPDIETVNTEATSLSFSNGDARMIYRTRISGGGVDIMIRSHRAAYVPFIKSLFKALGPAKLDPRSFELFEYFEGGHSLKDMPSLRSEIAAMPVHLLRRIANSLRLAGRLAQASSYFRIAYEKEPRDPKLLYEMSRFFHSSAQTEDTRLLQRSDACLRLASRLVGKQPDLLERIGEAFFERLDYKRATDCFRRALDLDPARFRANVGLAEIALRDGKLAHVAHFYNAAAGSADQALARLAGREARYYERLVSDDDFLGSELRRIRIANQIRWARRLAALTFFTAWLAAGVAGRFYPAAEHFGWAVMGASGLFWFASTITIRYFRRRNP